VLSIARPKEEKKHVVALFCCKTHCCALLLLKRSGEFCEEGFLFFVFPTFLPPEGAKNQVVKVVSGTESLVFQ